MSLSAWQMLKNLTIPSRGEADEQENFLPLQGHKLMQTVWKALCHYFLKTEHKHMQSPSKATSDAHL